MPKRYTEDEVKLGMIGAKYLGLKADEKAIGDKIEVEKKAIKELMTKVPLVGNGLHKETILLLTDGKTKILFRDQVSESVKTVDNIIDMVRAKLGKQADMYIQKVEVLQANALQNMYSAGLITDKDLADWTFSTQSHSLIVKKEK